MSEPNQQCSAAVMLPAPPPQAAEDPQLSVEDTIELCIGSFGWKQFLQSAIISFAWFFDAHQTFITVFADAQPKWSLNHSTAIRCNSTADSSWSSPCNDLCKLPRESWSWDLPAHSSVISEWGLQCAAPIVRGLPASAFLIGSIVSGFVLAMLADSSLGRKSLLVLSCMIMSLSGVLAAFSNNIWMYSGLRFVGGLGRGTIGGCAIVLASELMGKKWRDKVGIVGFFSFSLGFMSLPLIAFLLRGHSWRLIYLTTSTPCVIYSLIVYFFVHESPRWLFIRGRKEEFVKTLKSLSDGRQAETLSENLAAGKFEQDDAVYSVLRVFLQKQWALQRLVIVMVVSLGIGMTYYGIPLGMGNLSINLYLSTTLSALSEFPASLASWFMVRKMNRKRSVMGLCVLSGVCAVGSVFLGQCKNLPGFQLAAELAAFFGGCTAFDVMMIYVLELFPTCVRGLAVSAARQGMVLGGVVSPVLSAAAANWGNDWLSYGVFGAAILASGLGVAWLPETRGGALSDTMEEAERKRGMP